MLKLPKPEFLIGRFVNLREITVNDAKFVLDLRCDEKKSKYLNKTEYNLEKQIDYINNYLKKDDEWYFIIENKKHKPLGTVRIYDVNNDQYTSGSWLMSDGSSAQEVLEGSLLLRSYAFNILGFKKDYYTVRKDNKKVIRFHNISGAKQVGEDDIDYFFEYTIEDFNKNKDKLYKMLG